MNADLNAETVRLLREARDLLYHNSYCGTARQDKCCGCNLEAEILAHLEQFDGEVS